MRSTELVQIFFLPRLAVVDLQQTFTVALAVGSSLGEIKFLSGESHKKLSLEKLLL